jgi:hypothetical protein
LPRSSSVPMQIISAVMGDRSCVEVAWKLLI